jgi:hypothetical protein
LAQQFLFANRSWDRLIARGEDPGGDRFISARRPHADVDSVPTQSIQCLFASMERARSRAAWSLEELTSNYFSEQKPTVQLGALYPNGYTAGLYNNSVKWHKGDTFKMITPDLQKAIQKANGADDTKPAFTKGWRLQP